ncbi:MAG: O-methyltransferase [Chloroflexi bacterium]|nr:O-methyltransferase [Chloroflexota bacterium]
MDEQRWTDVDGVIEELVLGGDPVLAQVITEAQDAGMPAISVPPAHGRLLQLLARTIGARRVLEVGTLAGYSAICLARALPPDGRLLSLELDPERAVIARRNVARAGLADRVEIRVGRAIDSLARLAAERPAPFDMAFVDADKRSNPAYLRACLELVRPGGLIVIDNVIRDGRILDAASEDPDVRGTREALAILGSEPRLLSTAIQTVGAKGWDGFAVALVLPASGATTA